MEMLRVYESPLNSSSTTPSSSPAPNGSIAVSHALPHHPHPHAMPSHASTHFFAAAPPPSHYAATYAPSSSAAASIPPQDFYYTYPSTQFLPASTSSSSSSSASSSPQVHHYVHPQAAESGSHFVYYNPAEGAASTRGHPYSSAPVYLVEYPYVAATYSPASKQPHHSSSSSSSSSSVLAPASIMQTFEHSPLQQQQQLQLEPVSFQRPRQRHTHSHAHSHKRRAHSSRLYTPPPYLPHDYQTASNASYASSASSASAEEHTAISIEQQPRSYEQQQQQQQVKQEPPMLEGKTSASNSSSSCNSSSAMRTVKLVAPSRAHNDSPVHSISSHTSPVLASRLMQPHNHITAVPHPACSSSSSSSSSSIVFVPQHASTAYSPLVPTYRVLNNVSPSPSESHDLVLRPLPLRRILSPSQQQQQQQLGGVLHEARTSFSPPRASVSVSPSPTPSSPDLSVELQYASDEQDEIDTERRKRPLQRRSSSPSVPPVIVPLSRATPPVPHYQHMQPTGGEQHMQYFPASFPTPPPQFGFSQGPMSVFPNGAAYPQPHPHAQHPPGHFYNAVPFGGAPYHLVMSGHGMHAMHAEPKMMHHAPPSSSPASFSRPGSFVSVNPQQMHHMNVPMQPHPRHLSQHPQHHQQQQMHREIKLESEHKEQQPSHFSAAAMLSSYANSSPPQLPSPQRASPSSSSSSSSSSPALAKGAKRSALLMREFVQDYFTQHAESLGNKDLSSISAELQTAYERLYPTHKSGGERADRKPIKFCRTFIQKVARSMGFLLTLNYGLVDKRMKHLVKIRKRRRPDPEERSRKKAAVAPALATSSSITDADDAYASASVLMAAASASASAQQQRQSESLSTSEMSEQKSNQDSAPRSHESLLHRMAEAVEHVNEGEDDEDDDEEHENDEEVQDDGDEDDGEEEEQEDQRSKD